MKKDKNSNGKKRRRPKPRNARHGKPAGGNKRPASLAEAIRARFAPLGGVELGIPPRDPMRDPPDFMRDPPDFK